MSLDFPGASTACSVNLDNTNLNYQPPITWSCWIIPDVLPQTVGVNHFGLNDGYMFYFPNALTVGAYVRTTNPVSWLSVQSATLTAGSLYHLCAVCYLASVTEPNDTIKIDFYVNGVKTTVSSTGWATRGINYPSNQGLRVGRYFDATSNFNGKIEEFAVWNAQLTATQILQLWSSYKKRMPLMIKPANLQLYWPLDDYNPGDVNIARAIDMSANGRNAGSITGGASITARESIMRGGII